MRPPASLPYRPPGPNRLPGPQPAPIYQPPDLLPPTDRDLKGKICIYSNAPVWELKKIRYRYPGESWKEIVGDRFTSQVISGIYILDPSQSYLITSANSRRTNNYSTMDGWPQSWLVSGADFIIPPVFTRGFSGFGSNYQAYVFYAVGKLIGERTYAVTPTIVSSDTWYGVFCLFQVQNLITEELIEPTPQCVFKVFDISNQEILSITRDVCPEVIVVPERCYFRPENERLVGRWIVDFLDHPLRVEYQGHCATVWKDGIINLPPYPLQIYKECSDNPNCPPPRIRFDKKCEEKCEQCPPGTAIKVLLGSRIACVDAVGCVLKFIKFKPGCNNYDCICS